MRQLPSLSQPIIQVVIIMPVTILLRPLAKPVHFTIRKSAKVRYACGYLHRRKIQLQPEQGLDIIMQTRYNIGTKYIVCVCRSVLWLSDAHFI